MSDTKSKPAKIGLVRPKVFENKSEAEKFRRSAHQQLDHAFDLCETVEAFSVCVFDGSDPNNTPSTYSIKENSKMSPLDIPDKTRNSLNWCLYKGW